MSWRDRRIPVAPKKYDGGRLILIVDDDEGVTDTFSRMLTDRRFATVTAHNALDALARARIQCPDAVVLDFRMPLIDGLGFLRRFRRVAQWRRVPVAVVTGDYFLEDAAATELRALGARVLFKPIWTEDLINSLKPRRGC